MNHRKHKTANDYKNRLAPSCVFPDDFRYVPLMFVDDASILGPDLLAIGNATYYEFGILSSDAHMAWLRAVGHSSAGLFDYTPDRVYNTLPWPNRDKLTEAQRTAVEDAARQIEAARRAHDDFEFGKDYPTDAMPSSPWARIGSSARSCRGDFRKESMAEELKFPVVAHHRFIVNAPARDDRARGLDHYVMTGELPFGNGGNK